MRGWVCGQFPKLHTVTDYWSSYQTKKKGKENKDFSYLLQRDVIVPSVWISFCIWINVQFDHPGITCTFLALALLNQESSSAGVGAEKKCMHISTF